MNKVEIKLKSGESLFLSITREGHAHIEDIYKHIEDAIDEESIFVKFNTHMIQINEILYVKLVEDDEQKQEKQPEKVNPNSLLGAKPKENLEDVFLDEKVREQIQQAVKEQTHKFNFPKNNF